MKSHIKSYILPAAIILGLLFHSDCKTMAVIVPYIIFLILLLNFSAIDIKKTRFTRLDATLLLFQTVVSLAGYIIIKLATGNELLAQGLLIGVLCPVASSVVVVASAIGASRESTTPYTIYGNMLVTIIAPIYFSFIGEHQDMPFFESFMLIFMKIAPVIALPFFVALINQLFFPKAKNMLSRCKEWALILWAIALLLTLGQTIDFIFLYHEGNETNIVLLSVISLLSCFMQFGLGKIIGSRFNEKIAGGQLLGQKNTAMGIWMANTYLSPLAAVTLAFYSIFQNLFNSWQMWKYADKTAHK